MNLISKDLFRRLIFKKILLIASLCCFMSANAQRDRIWYFGNRAGLDFASGSPIAMTDNVINTYEGVSTICDQNGQLLFYTEGVNVFNRNHVVMPNGNGLRGGRSSTQSALSVLNPADPNRYYIFTTDEVVGTGIHYSEVDMTADNGLGNVVVKNVQLLAEGCEKLAAITHANGLDTWIIGHQWNTNAFYVWKVGVAGVSTPVISNVGNVITSPSPRIASVGQMKISPNGRQLALASMTLPTELFDFDTATGIISNPLTLMNDNRAFGLEFSPSGNALYVSGSPGGGFFVLYQFDLAAADVPSSITQITNPDRTLQLGMLDLAPDSKIYMANYGFTSLAVIDKPDVIGIGCNVIRQSTPLAGRINFFGLPTFFQPGLYITDINTVGDCQGSSIAFSADITVVPDSIQWDFGDANFSSDPDPTHTYALPGTYIVKLKVKKNGYERYFTETVTVLANPVAFNPPNMQLCDAGNDGQEVFNLSSQDALILGTQPSIGFVVTYHLTVDDTVDGLNAIPVNFTNTTNPQIIFARVTSPSGCYAVTAFFISVIPNPEPEMPLENWLCNGNAITLNAPLGYDGYVWSTLETTSSITVSQPGNYTLTVSESGCSASITITVNESTAPIIREINVRDWTDNDNQIVIVVDGIGNYEYSIDGISYQDSPVFTGLLPNIYTVFVRDKNGCGSTTEEVVILMYPKFFTPNGDGFNDFWAVRHAHYEPLMKINIFDRYGKILASFNGNEPGWDGLHQGNELPSTDYWFVITRGNGKEYKGHFSMLR